MFQVLIDKLYLYILFFLNKKKCSKLRALFKIQWINYGKNMISYEKWGIY